MRFDDSLETILAADMATPFGARSTWQQLVDLIGRGRIAPSPAAIGKLQALCTQVPPAARAASARSLAFAEPPAALVRLFAGDEISIAAPLLRIARLDAAAWIEMLPEMSPGTRSILRHRRDLPAAVNRALESFGSVDFVLANAGSSGDELPAAPSDLAGSAPATTTRIAQPAMSATPSESPFVSFASIALGLPVVAEALRHGKDTAPKDKSIAVADPNAVDLPPPREVPAGTFQIAELVARIDAYQRQRESASRAAGAFSVPVGGAEVQPELFALDPAPSRSFRFETDATGTVRWVDGAARAPLIGLSLDLAPSSAQSQVDGVAAGAFRRRAGFTNARLVVEGRSDAAGQWRINGIPVFDRASGRFTGYRGTARRPRADEMAEPARPDSNASSDALRQLVHELRTPTNAIAGFAEMIESQMLGPVAAPYRAHAAAIRGQASELLYAIDDI
ncbi:MAG: sensor histidine kinase, partial [Sphingomonas sp.]